jgi:hypothetical protein
MKDHKFQIFLLAIVFSTILSSCKVTEYLQQDDFYRSGSEWDHLRFPLIKPYYAIYITDELGWGIPLHSGISDSNIYYYTQLNDVQEISVENGVIMVYTPYEQDVEESIGENVYNWFVFMPDQNIEMGFDNEEDFLAYIQSYGIQQSSWRTPDDILKEYDELWCLPWIPTCN